MRFHPRDALSYCESPAFYILAGCTTYGASADCECLHYANHFLSAQTSRDQSMSIPIPSANQCHSLSHKSGSNRKGIVPRGLRATSGGPWCRKCSHSRSKPQESFMGKWKKIAADGSDGDCDGEQVCSHLGVTLRRSQLGTTCCDGWSPVPLQTMKLHEADILQTWSFCFSLHDNTWYKTKPNQYQEYLGKNHLRPCLIPAHTRHLV